MRGFLSVGIILSLGWAIAQDKKTAFLSDLPEFGVRVAVFQLDTPKFGKHGNLGYSYSNPPIKRAVVNGADFGQSISMGPAGNDFASVKYRLNKKADGFVAAVAQQDKAVPSSPCRFVVLGDNKVLWKSNSIDKPGVIEECGVGVGGVSILELRVYCEGPSNAGTIPLWLNPYVTFK